MSLLVCTALLLMPLAAPGSESLLLMFVPGVAACLLYGMVFANILVFLGVVFAVGALTAFLTGRPDAALWMVQGTGMTVLVITGITRGKTGPEIFLQGALFLCVVTFAAFAAGTGLNMAEGYRVALNNMSAELDASLRVYMNHAGETTLQPELALWFQQLKEIIVRFFPGLVMTTMVMSAFFNTVICRRCFYRTFGESSPLGAFSTWRLPEWLVWPWIAAGAACFIPQSLYSTMGKNLLLVISSVYFVAGIATAQFLFERFRVPRWIRWVTWLLIGIQWYGMIILAGLGLADVWVDFRQRLQDRDNTGDRNT